MLIAASHLLHETCYIVNFIVDNEPCVSAHIMGLNLLTRVVFRIAPIRHVVLFHFRVSFFTHLHLLSVTLAVEIQPKSYKS